MQEKDDEEEEKFEPKTQTEIAGGGGSGGSGGSGRPTRIGASTPDDSGESKRRPIREGPARRIRKSRRLSDSTPPNNKPKLVKIDNDITVKELAEMLGVPDVQVIKQLFQLGLPRTVNQIVEMQFARNAAAALGFKVELPPSDQSLE